MIRHILLKVLYSQLKLIIMIHNPKSEIDKLQFYQSKGYTSNYKMQDGKLLDIENGISFSSDEIVIVDEYRYEGMSNPSDMSILYVLEVAHKSKGIILMPYGPSADGELGWFMKEVSLNSLNRDRSELNKV